MREAKKNYACKLQRDGKPKKTALEICSGTGSLKICAWDVAVVHTAANILGGLRLYRGKGSRVSGQFGRTALVLREEKQRSGQQTWDQDAKPYARGTSGQKQRVKLNSSFTYVCTYFVNVLQRSE